MKLFVGFEKDSYERDNLRTFTVWAVCEIEAFQKIVEEYTELEYLDNNFREYVLEKAINWGLLEHLLLLDGKDPFSHSIYREREFNDFVYEKYPNKTEKEINNIIFGEVFESNTLEYFKGNNEWAEQYMGYIEGHIQAAEFNDEFFKFVCRKLVNTGDWTSFIIKQVEVPEVVQ